MYIRVFHGANCICVMVQIVCMCLMEQKDHTCVSHGAKGLCTCLMVQLNRGVSWCKRISYMCIYLMVQKDCVCVSYGAKG